MIDRATKFRYANPLAGTFVVAGFALLLVGLFVAARARGWLEGKIELHARFDSSQGTFGLQEGSEVYVRNILAGYVGKIVPNERGEMETVFVIRRRFHPLIAEDSVARVRKKFGMAGDAYVEIVEGKGRRIEDGATIPCQKDEDLMETVQKLFGEVQSIVLPTLQEVREIVHHVHRVTAGLAEGEGPAGALLKDPTITTEIRGALAAGTDLLRDSQRAVRETTRLLRAVQRHWLLRKYVEPEEGPETWLVGGWSPREVAAARVDWEDMLRVARTENDSAAIVRSAIALGYLLLSSGETNRVPALVEEARSEALVARSGLGETYLLESLWLLTAKDPLAAAHAAEAALGTASRRDKLFVVRAEAQHARALCEAGNVREGRRAIERAERAAGDEAPPPVAALIADAWGRVLRAERRPEQAAARYDQQAAHLARAGRSDGVAGALRQAGDCYVEAGLTAAAADRYYRSARSLAAAGQTLAAGRLAEQALALSQEAGDEFLERQVRRLIGELETATPQTGESVPTA